MSNLFVKSIPIILIVVGICLIVPFFVSVKVLGEIEKKEVEVDCYDINNNKIIGVKCIDVVENGFRINLVIGGSFLLIVGLMLKTLGDES
jgi:hypothetical protein